VLERQFLTGAVLVWGTALAAGCAEPGSDGVGGSEPAVSVAPSEPGSPSRSEPSGGSQVTPEVRVVVEAAIEDLRHRAFTGRQPIRVIIARPETFPNGALGCPKPGMTYTQGLVEGFRVILGQGDRAWIYTAGTDGVPQLCESGEKDGGQKFVPRPDGPD
jgi:hypothetical protein